MTSRKTRSDTPSDTRIPVLVSRCLLGVPCRYDGRTKTSVVARLTAPEILARIRWIPICPESDAGLPTPRPPCEIEPGGSADAVLSGHARLLTQTGGDVTREYKRGAEIALNIARACGARAALLKARSPSCSPEGVYDGTFRGKLIEGRGVTAETLARAGLTLWSEETLEACFNNVLHERFPDASL